MALNTTFSPANVIAVVSGSIASTITRILTGLYCHGKLIIACPNAADLATNGPPCGLSDDVQSLISLCAFALVTWAVGQYWPRSKEYLAASVATHPCAEQIIEKAADTVAPPTK